MTCIFGSPLADGLDWVHELVCSCISPLENKTCHPHVLCSMLYILVTKHLEPFKSLAPATSVMGTSEAFEGRCLHLTDLFNQFLSQIKSCPISFWDCLLGHLATKLVFQKRSFAGERFTIKRKTGAFVKWLSETESIILFHYGCAGRGKIRRIIEGERKQS